MDYSSGNPVHDDLIQADKGATEDEEDVGCVDGVGVSFGRAGEGCAAHRGRPFPAARTMASCFIGDGDVCSLQHTQKGLLDTLARDIL